MYKKYKSPISNQEFAIRLSDNLYILLDESSSYRDEYLAWVAEGNTAEEWTPEG